MRLIDAEGVLNSIEARCGCDAKDEWARGFDDACNEISELIEDAPTIEAEPVMHGRWIPTFDDGYYKCSVCSEVEDGMEFDGELYYKFCPHCGAKMG